MVTIPTTDRQFYDTQAKESGLATYSKALAPAVELLGKVFHEQEKLKMQALKQQASIDMATVTAEWRKQNALNPNDPEKLKELNAQYDDIIQQAKEQIDPYYRNEFEVLGTGVKNSFALKNSTWAVSQRGQNIKGYAGLIGDNTAKQVYDLVRAGDVDGAFASWEEGEKILLNQQGLDPVDSAKIIATMDNKVAQGIIYGLMETNPQMALDYLEYEKIRKSITPQQYHALKTNAEKQNYKYKLNSFKNNPTPENYDKLQKDVDLKKNDKEEAESRVAEYVDKTQIKDLEGARMYLEEFYKMYNVKEALEKNPEKEGDIEFSFFKNSVYAMKKIQDSTLSEEDKTVMYNSIYNMLYDNIYKNNIENLLKSNREYLAVLEKIKNQKQHEVELKDGIFSDEYQDADKKIEKFKKHKLYDQKKLETVLKNKANNSFMKALDILNKGGATAETDAYEVMYDCSMVLAQYLNPTVDLRKLKVDQEFVYDLTGETYIYKGIQNGDIMVKKVNK